MTDQAQLLRDALESYEHAIANGHREHDALSAFANISVPDLARAALSAPAQPASGEAVGYVKQDEALPGLWALDPIFLLGSNEPTGYNAPYKAVQYVATPPASQERAQPSGEVVAEFMGMRQTPEGTREFWGIGNLHHLPIGTKLYTAPQPAQPAARVAMMDEQANAIDRAIQLCEWIGETPHQRGSINGLAMQVAHELRGITSNGATAQPDHPKP